MSTIVSGEYESLERSRQSLFQSTVWMTRKKNTKNCPCYRRPIRDSNRLPPEYIPRILSQK